MPAPRPSNLKRAEWNGKCRQKLSEHIKDKLGTLIEPSQVRLKPNPDDVYRWETMSGKEHLFSRNISDHSIGALKELYRGVGISFEAVGNDKSSELPAGSVAGTYLHSPGRGVSFTSKINDLQNRLTIVADELQEWQNHSKSEADMRRQAEIRILELEGVIHATQNDNHKLKVDVQELKVTTEQSKSRLAKYRQAMSRILGCFEELESELALDNVLTGDCT